MPTPSGATTHTVRSTSNTAARLLKNGRTCTSTSVKAGPQRQNTTLRTKCSRTALTTSAFPVGLLHSAAHAHQACAVLVPLRSIVNAQ